MPKRGKKKGLYARKGLRKKNQRNHRSLIKPNQTSANLTQYASEKTAADVRPGASKDMIVDIGSKTTSVSDLTSNQSS